MASSLFFISSLFFLSLFNIIYVNSDSCSISKCTNYSNSKNLIPYPFRAPDQPLRCGLPGFELGCNKSTATPLLSFPNGDVFTVEYISNYSMNIEVTDVCLHEKLVRFNSSDTPFRAKGFTNFSLFTCPSSFRLFDYPASYKCREINCTRAIVCETYVNTSNLLDHGCNFVRNVNVAGIWSSVEAFSTSMSIYLTWEIPFNCKVCERGKVCRRDPNNFIAIQCLDVQAKEDIDFLSVMIPVVICLFVFSSFSVCIYYICQGVERRERNASSVVGAPTRQTHTIQGSNATQGLEQATLDAYPVVRVGDSGRVLINMEEKSCAICLSDYESKDVIKLLPECLHRFHSDCIDEWLLAKAVCPICRTMPQQTAQSESFIPTNTLSS